MNSSEKGPISYCVTCKDDREMMDTEVLEMPGKTGTSEVVKGVCRVCGSSMFFIPSGS